MITEIKHNAGDAITGERIFPGERALDTGYPVTFPFELRETSTRFIKEATIVWLAERAGFRICNGDACKCHDGDSRDTKSVDGEDVSVGGGEAPAGKAKARGRKSAS